jgi:hypothetical protein
MLRSFLGLNILSVLDILARLAGRSLSLFDVLPLDILDVGVIQVLALNALSCNTLPLLTLLFSLLVAHF